MVESGGVGHEAVVEARAPTVQRPTRCLFNIHEPSQLSPNGLARRGRAQERSGLLDKAAPEICHVLREAGGPNDVVDVPLDDNQFISGNIEWNWSQLRRAPIWLGSDRHQSTLGEGVKVWVNWALAGVRSTSEVVPRIVAASACRNEVKRKERVLRVLGLGEVVVERAQAVAAAYRACTVDGTTQRFNEVEGSRLGLVEMVKGRT